MKRSTSAAVAVLALGTVVLLGGCSGSAGPGQTDATPASSPSTSKPVGPVSFSTVSDLKDAWIAAGGTCDDWVEDDVVQTAAQSGHCSDDDVFMTFADDSSKAEAVDNLKQFASTDIPTTLLVGPNWIINDDSAPSYASKLGGTAVTYTG